MALLTPASVRTVLADHDLRPNRALGQHFLADPNTARRIVRLAGVEPGDRVLEIGPGIGSLTLALAEAGARVLALELDRHLLAPLHAVVGDRATIVAGDATTVDFSALLGDARRSPPESRPGTRRGWRCVSNLPYNVATPVVVRVLEAAPDVEHLLVMVQREVGERLAAAPGGRDYGAVSVKVAYFATAEIVGSVSPRVFVPAPNVESALVRITRRSAPPVEVPSPARLFELIRAGFAQRRKMLRRAMSSVIGPDASEVLTRAGVDPSARAEALGLEDWAAVARADDERPGAEGARSGRR